MAKGSQLPASMFYFFAAPLLVFYAVVGVITNNVRVLDERGLTCVWVSIVCQHMSADGTFVYHAYIPPLSCRGGCYFLSSPQKVTNTERSELMSTYKK